MCLSFCEGATETDAQKIDTLEQKMFSNPLHKDPRLPEIYAAYASKEDAQTRIRELKRRIQATNDVLQMEELKCRKRVLRRLGFTTSADIVDMKGRVACEISTGDELLLTELIFNGVFNPLSPEQCAGLLSCFVFTEKVYSLYRSRWDVLTIDAERADDKAQGGVGRASASNAGDRQAHSEGFARIEAPARRRRIRVVLQGRAHGRSCSMVSRCLVLRHTEGLSCHA